MYRIILAVFVVVAGILAVPAKRNANRVDAVLRDARTQLAAPVTEASVSSPLPVSTEMPEGIITSDVPSALPSPTPTMLCQVCVDIDGTPQWPVGFDIDSYFHTESPPTGYP